MGLLDDAIREHLELKRRRGADAEEVSRLEQEALGPPQRGEFAAAAAASPAEPVEAAEPAEPLDAPAEPAEPADDEPIAAVQAEPAAAPPRAPAEPEWLEDEPEPPAPAVPPAEEPTALYDVESAGPDAASDDVLEETPDFLQETPEHDRLWFEQKPPRDFDLDR
jgi:hypothetical protein